MQGKNRLQSSVNGMMARVTGAVNGLLFVIMVAMALVLGANIALRFLFNSPITWSNVVTRYAYIYIVLLGTAISYIEGSHAQIDVIHQMAPPWLKAVFDLCHFVIMMFLCGVLIYFGTIHTINMWAVHSPVVTWLPIGLVYLSVPVSAVVMLLFLVKCILDLILSHK